VNKCGGGLGGTTTIVTACSKVQGCTQ